MEDVFIKQIATAQSIADPAALEKLKKETPARIGIGHAGARYRTESMLRFAADQAMASEAVFSEVNEDTLKRLGVFEVQTTCKNKIDMLTRPDWGRLFDEDTKKLLLQKCMHNPQVQIYFGDGLSAPSIEANIPDLYPAIKAELESQGITVGTPFFVRYCRVNTARIIAPLLGAEVVCVLIGERPGLITDESMSAYIAYNAREDMQESEYTVVSNISRQGIPRVEAAAHIAELIKTMLETKTSGIRLQADYESSVN